MTTERQQDAVLFNFLHKLGLETFYPNKLTVPSVLEINKSSIYEDPISSVHQIPFVFLIKLFKLNAECRTCTQFITYDEENDDLDLDLDVDLYTATDSADNKINPLDLIVALFLCADSFLQQEIALKMSMCQFSVPLLLPHGSNDQCTLMLWALRDIVKEWCPHDLSESRGFVENSIVQANIPFYSFVRLKSCSLSKSQILNHVLSSGQQNHNIFIHRDMEGGALKREISNGLVEVCWFLPSGRENVDVLPEPTALANLRGDICDSFSQFTFLFQVSTATFVFLDKIEEEEHRILTSLQDVNSKLFLVVNRKDSSAENMMSVKALVKELGLPNSSVKIKNSAVNVAEFSKKLCATIKTSLLSIKTTLSIVNMTEKAVELGLSVDEGKTYKQKQAAEEIIEGIGIRNLPQYKKQQLPLQGDNWKKLSQLEKKECRLIKSDNSGLEEDKSQLQEEKQRIREEQRTCKLKKGMNIFIENISAFDKEKRDLFLKWMKLKLNTHSRKKLSELRNKFREHCRKKDLKLIEELDKDLMDSSLGMEHYMREMGLIYEFSMDRTTEELSQLPGVVADMLLDGHPFELLDGDASNIPERWVTDVLMELHKKVGENSRLLVLTVLGVQSSGKSTLLNTMFGVQFPVSSGRCTRGAYIIFLRVGEDMKNDMNCDFIVLIDTEGLKSPELAQLEGSYEHDNQLATFVIGLSDVTIINIAMENSTEMKDVLQITAHAFLRMKEIGKKPVCYFVHQNVAAVSGYEKAMTERQHLLDQLNEMTKIAAEMEKQPTVLAFTDVLKYDIEKNHWNIPGLWHGTPPMAPVNTGYSEAVADLKKKLLETIKNNQSNKCSHIPEFLEWMRSLWKAVKYENFIFSFRNTLVAHAYDNLCKEFHQWEWDFRKEILSWQTAAELEISNVENDRLLETWKQLVESKKTEVSSIIEQEQNNMKIKLSKYYKRKDRHVHLIEKYKAEFNRSISSLANEIQHSVRTKLDCSLELKISLKKVQEIQRKYRGVIEDRVMKLLSDCKDATLSDEQLTLEFEKMWEGATANVFCLKETDIKGCVLKQLKKHFSKYNENLDGFGGLLEASEGPFKTRRGHVDSVIKTGYFLWSGGLQNFADSIIKSCKQFINDKVKTGRDYQDSFTNDLLEEIDQHLKPSSTSYKTNMQFETDLKVHICAIAAREFYKMHRRFLSDNDPRAQLEKYKTPYLSDFLDLYKQRDHCQRKASDFVQFCIKPAVEENVNRFLGISIVDEIVTSSPSAEYSSRSFFQYNILKELLLKEDFDSFLKYISHYELYVKDWIFQHVLQKMSKNDTLSKLKTQSLHAIVDKITSALEEATKAKDGTLLPNNQESISELMSNLRKLLIKDISFSVEAEKAILFQIQSTCHPYIHSLTTSIEDMKTQLEENFSNSEEIGETLHQLPVKPQDELFRRVFGCGQQCPFCKVPCEAGGKEHKQHHAAVHRPQGIGGFSIVDNEKLVETLCTTVVNSNVYFVTNETKAKGHPYKNYTTYYPDWHIPPEPTKETSDYWKYVLVHYNDRFAQNYETKPADVPEAWRKITKEQALKGLKDAFNIK